MRQVGVLLPVPSQVPIRGGTVHTTFPQLHGHIPLGLDPSALAKTKKAQRGADRVRPLFGQYWLRGAACGGYGGSHLIASRLDMPDTLRGFGQFVLGQRHHVFKTFFHQEKAPPKRSLHGAPARLF
jgi:hypothetical protein